MVPAFQHDRTMSASLHRFRGFTLIEVMIAVAVVAILTAIALPSYREYIARGHRAEARAGLMQAAQWLERAATATGTYPASDIPQALKTVSSGGYAISANVPTGGGSFTLTATRQGVQANDRCGNFTLDNAGVRGITGGTATVAECWGK